MHASCGQCVLWPPSLAQSVTMLPGCTLVGENAPSADVHSGLRVATASVLPQVGWAGRDVPRLPGVGHFAGQVRAVYGPGQGGLRRQLQGAVTCAAHGQRRTPSQRQLTEGSRLLALKPSLSAAPGTNARHPSFMAGSSMKWHKHDMNREHHLARRRQGGPPQWRKDAQHATCCEKCLCFFFLH